MTTKRFKSFSGGLATEVRSANDLFTFSFHGIKYMNSDTAGPRPVSPVWQFICLLAPVVMSGFYLVYALVGLFIDGPDKVKWSDEALQVGSLVSLIIVVMNLLVMMYALYHKLKLTHLLWISPIVHITIAIALTAMVSVIII